MNLIGKLMLAAVLVGAAPLASGQAPAPQGATTATDVVTETGEIDGAKFRIDMPAQWNKGLMVMNHGYSPTPRVPADGPPSARLRIFLDRGFAVAQSSYSLFERRLGGRAGNDRQRQADQILQEEIWRRQADHRHRRRYGNQHHHHVR
jgi:hypothetical protein